MGCDGRKGVEGLCGLAGPRGIRAFSGVSTGCRRAAASWAASVVPAGSGDEHHAALVRQEFFPGPRLGKVKGAFAAPRW
jgi:hypothetical protein